MIIEVKIHLMSQLTMKFCKIQCILIILAFWTLVDRQWRSYLGAGRGLAPPRFLFFIYIYIYIYIYIFI